MLRLQLVDLAARLPHGDLAGRGDAPLALEDGHVVFLHQEGDAAGQLRHGLVLALEHGGQVQFDLADEHAVAGRFLLGKREVVTGVEQRLAGDAADVQAGAAEGLAAFDEGSFQAELRAANRRDVAARAAADDNEIKFRHGDTGNIRRKARSCKAACLQVALTCPSPACSERRCFHGFSLGQTRQVRGRQHQKRRPRISGFLPLVLRQVRCRRAQESKAKPRVSALLEQSTLSGEQRHESQQLERAQNGREVAGITQRFELLHLRIAGEIHLR